MALDLETHLRIRNKNNTFALVNDIQGIELKEGYCVATMEVNENHYNPLDTVHGGCIFTLADVAGSYAACSYGYWVTTLDCTIQYIRAAAPPRTKTLTATAKAVKAGKKVLVFDVEVKNQDDKLIARATFTYMNLGEEIPDLKDEDANFVVHKYEKKPD